MSECQQFPNTWEEFEQLYGFTDKEEVYTNGSRLMQSFRVKQWLDHIAEPERKKGRWQRRKGSDCWECSQCHAVLENDDLGMHNFYFCYHCGANMMNKSGYMDIEEVHYSDLIRREDVDKAIRSICNLCGEDKKNNGVMCGTCNLDNFISVYDDLPSAEPERKKGEWLWELADNGWADHICSECGWTRNTDVHVHLNYNYCPNCGADMRGE